jgi:hypothetical protein
MDAQNFVIFGAGGFGYFFNVARYSSTTSWLGLLRALFDLPAVKAVDVQYRANFIVVEQIGRPLVTVLYETIADTLPALELSGASHPQSELVNLKVLFPHVPLQSRH